MYSVYSSKSTAEVMQTERRGQGLRLEKGSQDQTCECDPNFIRQGVYTLHLGDSIVHMSAYKVKQGRVSTSPLSYSFSMIHV